MQLMPLQLQEVYQRHNSNDSQPSYDELQTIFLAIIQRFSRTFMVLDALDECSLVQRADLCEFILRLANTGRIVKIFVISRKVLDIERFFQRKSIPKIEVEAAKVDRDIEVYVRAQIELLLQNSSLIGDTALKDKILSTLTAKAGGM